MSSSFTFRSATGAIVSLLNPVDISPVDVLHHDHHSALGESLPTTPAPKKTHVCKECDRSFSTMGHLNRHYAVHTGNKDHACPFPGCGKTASRPDNLVQHYRMHLPRGEHARSTTYIRCKMQDKMVELGISPFRKTRGQKARVPAYTVYISDKTKPVSMAAPVSVPARPMPMSPESSVYSPSPPPDDTRPMTGSSESAFSSSSNALLTPSLSLSSAYAGQGRSHTLPHDHPLRSRDFATAYQPFSCAVDYYRNSRVSNAREE